MNDQARVVDLAGRDPLIARRLAEAEIRRADADAAADRRLRVDGTRAQQARRDRDAQRAHRKARRDERAGRRGARRRAAGKRVAGWVDYARNNAPAVYSAVVYGLAVTVAVGGQVSIATERGLPVIAGVGMAGFIEGLALSMALTAHQLRLRGERAFAPRVLTWVAAGFAAAMNAYAHREDLVLAAALGAASAVGIVVWEIRSGAKHRTALRKAKVLPAPATRFGVRRWVRYPRETARAWSLDIRLRVSPEAHRLLGRVSADRARRKLVRVARKAARRAAREGDAGAALAALVRLADAAGVPSPAVPAIESGPGVPAAAVPAGMGEGDTATAGGVPGDGGAGDTPRGDAGAAGGDAGVPVPVGDTAGGVPQTSGDAGTTRAVAARRGSGTRPGTALARRTPAAVTATGSTGEAGSTAERMRVYVLAAWRRGEDPVPAALDQKFGTTQYAKRIVRGLRAQYPDLAAAAGGYGDSVGQGHGDG